MNNVLIRKSKYPELNDAEWLRTRYINEKMSCLQITRLVGCKSAKQVTQALRRYGIPVCTKSEGSLRKSIGDGFELNASTASILNGCLLGDGGLKTNHENSWNPVFHKNNIYYDHIIFVAKDLFGDRYLERVTGPHIQSGGFSTFGGKTYVNKPIFRLSSLTHPELMPMYKSWYPESNNFKKVVPTDIEINPTVLLHWFLDDGYSYIAHKKYKNTKYNRDQQRVYFCTQSFQKEELDMLSQKVFDTTGLIIRPRLHQRNGAIRGTGYEMELSETQIQKFYDIIGPCPVPSFEYKWKPL